MDSYRHIDLKRSEFIQRVIFVTSFVTSCLQVLFYWSFFSFVLLFFSLCFGIKWFRFRVINRLRF